MNSVKFDFKDTSILIEVEDTPEAIRELIQLLTSYISWVD